MVGQRVQVDGEISPLSPSKNETINLPLHTIITSSFDQRPSEEIIAIPVLFFPWKLDPEHFERESRIRNQGRLWPHQAAELKGS